MNILNLFRRKPQDAAPRRNKKGNSLAFVMIIGTVLIIWVMCILPLMNTTGEAAYKTQANQSDYLAARSSIEFCKSELEKIVEDNAPYTFAVTGNAEDKYTVIPKRLNGNGLNPGYSSLVNSAGNDDSQETPLENDAGKTVCAICEVTANVQNPNAYDLTITTYAKGEEVMTYTAIFTPSGTLMINPEAYKHDEALPLSNFVLVDGKLGEQKIWDSTISMSNFYTNDKGKYLFNLDYTENMLKFMLTEDRPKGYADAGRFPVVFKTTAHAAEGTDITIGEAITIGALTSENHWIMPKAGSNNTAGNIKYELSGSTVSIKLYRNKSWTDISNDCTVYFNGTASSDRIVPSNPGYYTVTVDYNGDAAFNILPIKGLDLGTIDKPVTKGENKVTNSDKSSIKSFQKKEETDPKGNVTRTYYEITLEEVSGVQYGIVSANLKNGSWTYSDVSWQSEKKFTIESEDLANAYFFYIYRPSTFSDGKVMAASDAKLVAMMYAPQFVSKLDDLKSGDAYTIVGQNGNAYYALSTSSNTPDVDKLTLTEGFFITSDELDSWTVTKGDTSSKPTLSIANENGKYLTLDGKAYCTWKTRTSSHTHLFWSSNCTENYDDSGVTCELNLSTGYAFQMTFDNGSFSLFDQYQLTDSRDKYDCFFNNDQKVNVNINEKRYLSLNGSASASSSSATVKFMLPAPKAPSVPISVMSHSYDGSNSVSFAENVNSNYIKNNISNKGAIEKIYANGVEMDGNKLNAGKYEIVVKANNGKITYYAALGTITITKANQSGQPSIEVNTISDDDFGVTVTGSNWNSNGGVRYFGYKAEDESDYHWYSSTENAYSFRLRYGKYGFAIMESGTTNYVGTSREYDRLVELKADDVEDSQIHINKFVYTYDSTTGETIWYELPEGVNPELVTLVFGTEQPNGTIIWSETYSADCHYHGVIISNSNYNDLNHVLKLTTPVGITNVYDHQSSMISGTSLYFMAYNNSSNPGASINTHGNDIYLKADLLVLNGGIEGETDQYGEVHYGKVSVEPYTEGENKPGNTLLFVANKNGIELPGGKKLAGRNFYIVPKGTDLCMLNAMDTTLTSIGEPDADNIKYMFRQKTYPEIDLDIAYATKSQLAYVVSSETLGWSNNGTLISTSNAMDSKNSKHLVCMYLTDVSNEEINLLANRVMIAAEQTHTDEEVVTTSNTLTIPKTLSLTTRYVSVDADQICKGSGDAKLIINNLGEDDTYLTWLKKLSDRLNFTNYVSKTLQIDYERFTSIYDSNNNLLKSTPSRIYRLDDGVNLLANPVNEELMVTYTPSELEKYAKNYFSSVVKTVDRYVKISSGGGSSSINFSSFLGSDYKPYANYLYFDNTITSINFTSITAGGVYINTMESGYSDQEYLGLFSVKSSEHYSGTILYFERAVTIKVRSLTDWGDYTIPAGFYYVTANGTNLITIAKNPANYRIDEEKLRSLTVYIDPTDGSMSNAYVDTGIYDDKVGAIGGFSGGNME